MFYVGIETCARTAYICRKVSLAALLLYLHHNIDSSSVVLYPTHLLALWNSLSQGPYSPHSAVLPSGM